jgi:glycosyltransferase involved in cell wall biosynthesis
MGWRLRSEEAEQERESLRFPGVREGEQDFLSRMELRLQLTANALHSVLAEARVLSKLLCLASVAILATLVMLVVTITGASAGAISRFADSARLYGSRGLPSVCVVVTLYNTEPYLDDMFRSLSDQTYQGPWEAIIVDDFSQDGSRVRLQQLAALDSRIVPVLLPMRTAGGTGTPANVGIEECVRRGGHKYLTFADSDDELRRDFLSQMVDAAERDNVPVVMSGYNVMSRTASSWWPLQGILGSGILPKPKSELEHFGQLPYGTPFDPRDHLRHLSRVIAAPWRKLLRMDFVRQHRIRFPEGDFLYEDNVLHWTVITRAPSMSVIEDELVHHRVSRTLTESVPVQLSSFFTVFDLVHADVARLISDGRLRPEVAEIAWDWMQGFSWICNRQFDVRMRDKFVARFRRAEAYWQPKSVARGGDGTVALQAPSRCQPDLSVVIPTFNAGAMLPSLLRSLNAVKDISMEVFIVDAGSTDATQLNIHRLLNNPQWYNITLREPTPAGVARNLVTPLLEGKYTIFLDADDDVNPAMLESAVLYALSRKVKVVLAPYTNEVVYNLPNGSDLVTPQGMLPADRRVWLEDDSKLSPGAASMRALKLVNYPWQKIVSTRWMQLSRIYFGVSAVQNDVQFHWSTVLSAGDSLLFMPADSTPLVHHRKFTGATRMQLTKNSEDRISMVGAVQATHAHISSLPGFCGSRAAVLWAKKAQNFFSWALSEKLVPRPRKAEFKRRTAAVMRCISACGDSRCLLVS